MLHPALLASCAGAPGPLKADEVGEASHTGARESSQCDTHHVLCPPVTRPAPAADSHYASAHVLDDEHVEGLPALLTVSLVERGSLKHPGQVAARLVEIEGKAVLVLGVTQGSKVALFTLVTDPTGRWTLHPLGVLGEAVADVSEEAEPIVPRHAGAVHSVAFAQWLEYDEEEEDAEAQLTWGLLTAGEDGSVRSWSLIDSQELECIGGPHSADDEDVHEGPVLTTVRVPFTSPAGDVKCGHWSAGADGTLRAWNLSDGFQTRDMTLTVPGTPTSMAAIEVLHPSEEAAGPAGDADPAMLTIVATGTDAGAVELRNFAEASVHATIPASATPGPVRQVVGVWWARGGEVTQHQSTPRGQQFVCDRGFAVLCEGSCDVLIYSPAEEREVARLRGHTRPVVGAAMVYPPAPTLSEEAAMWGADLASPATAQQSRLVTLDAGGQLRLFDVATGECDRVGIISPAVAPPPGEREPFLALAAGAMPGGGFALFAAQASNVHLLTLE